MTMESDVLPLEPMAPIRCEALPEGDEWGYQLKWDGVRIISHIYGKDEIGSAVGAVDLYSRKMLNKNRVYPEIIRLLQGALSPQTIAGGLILDGEAVVYDPQLQRPVFQLVLQRERSEASRLTQTRWPVTYVLFDILYRNGEDLRARPYSERHRILQELFPDRHPSLFVSDLFGDGELLWGWVEQNGWEGVVAKRLSSPYRIGKKHTDWYKKKTALLLDVKIVGIIVRGGHAASMVMIHEDMFLGRVSLGLNRHDKARLMDYAAVRGGAASPFPKLPAELTKDQIIWLREPFGCRVTGLEITAAGLLRHPKLVSFELPTSSSFE